MPSYFTIYTLKVFLVIFGQVVPEPPIAINIQLLAITSACSYLCPKEHHVLSKALLALKECLPVRPTMSL